jgi:Domain of unknown function (DUF5658)
MLQPLVNTAPLTDRRGVGDRRTRTFYALFRGSMHPRRRSPRRDSDVGLAAVDWHDAQWLAVALLILVLSSADGLLTLMLTNRGAYEANPFMAPLVYGSGFAFAIAKMALTATGVVVLILLVRLRAFGRVPVSAVLYAILAGYGVLILYELWLLERLVAAG